MKIITGKSGITVLLSRVKGNIVDMRYIVSVGSVDEEPSESGYCHALEHMVFASIKGNSRIGGVPKLSNYGGIANAYTQPDKTCFYISCLKKYWKSSYRALADGFYSSDFSERHWETVEKPAILSEMRTDYDDKDSYVLEQTYQDALGTEYRPIGGCIDNIHDIRLEDLTKMYDEYYCGKNVTLLVTGDLTEQQVLREVNRDDKLRGATPKKRKIRKYTFNKRPLMLLNEAEQSTILLLKALRLPRVPKTRACLEIGIQCLDDYLYEELREKRGLCYSVEAELEWCIPNSLFLTITTSTGNGDFKKIERALKQALLRFYKEGLKKERIESIKLGQEYAMECAKGNVDYVASCAWNVWNLGLKNNFMRTQEKILREISVRDVRRVTMQSMSTPVKITKMGILE